MDYTQEQQLIEQCGEEKPGWEATSGEQTTDYTSTHHSSRKQATKINKRFHNRENRLLNQSEGVTNATDNVSVTNVTGHVSITKATDHTAGTNATNKIRDQMFDANTEDDLKTSSKQVITKSCSQNGGKGLGGQRDSTLASSGTLRDPRQTNGFYEHSSYTSSGNSAITTLQSVVTSSVLNPALLANTVSSAGSSTPNFSVPSAFNINSTGDSLLPLSGVVFPSNMSTHSVVTPPGDGLSTSIATQNAMFDLRYGPPNTTAPSSERINTQHMVVTPCNKNQTSTADVKQSITASSSGTSSLLKHPLMRSQLGYGMANVSAGSTAQNNAWPCVNANSCDVTTRGVNRNATNVSLAYTLSQISESSANTSSRAHGAISPQEMQCVNVNAQSVNVNSTVSSAGKASELVCTSSDAKESSSSQVSTCFSNSVALANLGANAKHMPPNVDPFALYRMTMLVTSLSNGETIKRLLTSSDKALTNPEQTVVVENNVKDVLDNVKNLQSFTVSSSTESDHAEGNVNAFLVDNASQITTKSEKSTSGLGDKAADPYDFNAHAAQVDWKPLNSNTGDLHAPDTTASKPQEKQKLGQWKATNVQQRTCTGSSLDVEQGKLTEHEKVTFAAEELSDRDQEISRILKQNSSIVSLLQPLGGVEEPQHKTETNDVNKYSSNLCFASLPTNVATTHNTSSLATTPRTSPLATALHTSSLATALHTSSLATAQHTSPHLQTVRTSLATRGSDIPKSFAISQNALGFDVVSSANNIAFPTQIPIGSEKPLLNVSISGGMRPVCLASVVDSSTKMTPPSCTTVSRSKQASSATKRRRAKSGNSSGGKKRQTNIDVQVETKEVEEPGNMSPMKEIQNAGLDLVDRLKANIQEEVPKCRCPGQMPFDQNKEGPYYTHLGAGSTVADIRQLIENRLSISGKALRIEKVAYTGKEGKNEAGCPIAKWILRRSGAEEKVLCVVRQRKGHTCETAVIVVAIVVWDGIPEQQANDLYEFIHCTLPTNGYETERRCGTNEQRTCACQGWDSTVGGASFSYGCSWSMYYNGCKFAKSTNPRKFKLKNQSQEPFLEDRLKNLASHIAPIYEKAAPDAFRNMTQFEEESVDCRLGNKPGRPYSGVTAVVDFCAHAHKDLHNMNNGCTTVVTLTKHRGLSKPEEEQLHVLPMHVLDMTGEDGDPEKQQEKVRNGSVECLTTYPTTIRIRPTPLPTCKKRQKAKGSLACKTPQSKVSPVNPISPPFSPSSQESVGSVKNKKSRSRRKQEAKNPDGKLLSNKVSSVGFKEPPASLHTVKSQPGQICAIDAGSGARYKAPDTVLVKQSSSTQDSQQGSAVATSQSFHTIPQGAGIIRQGAETTHLGAASMPQGTGSLPQGASAQFTSTSVPAKQPPSYYEAIEMQKKKRENVQSTELVVQTVQDNPSCTKSPKVKSCRSSSKSTPCSNLPARNTSDEWARVMKWLDWYKARVSEEEAFKPAKRVKKATFGTCLDPSLPQAANTPTTPKKRKSRAKKKPVISEATSQLLTPCVTSGQAQYSSLVQNTQVVDSQCPSEVQTSVSYVAGNSVKDLQPDLTSTTWNTLQQPCISTIPTQTKSFSSNVSLATLPMGVTNDNSFLTSSQVELPIIYTSVSQVTDSELNSLCSGQFITSDMTTTGGTPAPPGGQSHNTDVILGSDLTSKDSNVTTSDSNLALHCNISTDCLSSEIRPQLVSDQTNVRNTDEGLAGRVALSPVQQNKTIESQNNIWATSRQHSLVTAVDKSSSLSPEEGVSSLVMVDSASQQGDSLDTSVPVLSAFHPPAHDPPADMTRNSELHGAITNADLSLGQEVDPTAMDTASQNDNSESQRNWNGNFDSPLHLLLEAAQLQSNHSSGGLPSFTRTFAQNMNIQSFSSALTEPSSNGSSFLAEPEGMDFEGGNAPQPSRGLSTMTSQGLNAKSDSNLLSYDWRDDPSVCSDQTPLLTLPGGETAALGGQTAPLAGQPSALGSEPSSLGWSDKTANNQSFISGAMVDSNSVLTDKCSDPSQISQPVSFAQNSKVERLNEPINTDLNASVKAPQQTPIVPTMPGTWADCSGKPDGAVEKYTDNKERLEDADIGGVALALTHGSVLFEVAKKELHATTAVKNPNRSLPTRISLVFYQHKNLNYPVHGHERYREKSEMWRKRREQKAEAETNNQVKTDLDAKIVPDYKSAWDTVVNYAMTTTTNSITTKWVKSQPAVTGPYQRWL